MKKTADELKAEFVALQQLMEGLAESTELSLDEFMFYRRDGFWVFFKDDPKRMVEGVGKTMYDAYCKVK